MTPSPARQLLLDLSLNREPSLDNFVAGNNRELLARLRGLTDTRNFDTVYLWGPEGSGKSHLVAATADLAGTRRKVVRHAGLTSPDDFAPTGGMLLVIDDVEYLSDEAQIALFRTFNAARINGLALLLTGSRPPLELALREDLRTRIGQTLIYELQPLSDEEKSAALRRHAGLRGMRLDDSVVQYLMRHGRRDLPSLMAMLDGLDRSSLEQKRPPTIPLLRELMQTSLDLTPNESRPV
jgi:DnaA family protein